jgi:hypothetical protein
MSWAARAATSSRNEFVFPERMSTRSAIIAVLLLLLSGCAWPYARLSYEFVPLSENSRIMYEPGAENLAKLVADNLAASMLKVEERQYLPFRDSGSIKIYVFNDRERYARFSRSSILSRGSSTLDEVYLSEKLKEKVDTLPSILVHELSHVHIRQHTGTYRYVTDIPGWFLEGIAVVTSSGGGAENVTEQQARAAIRDAVLFEPDGAGSIFGHKVAHDYGLEAHMYYRQAGLFVEYLIESDPAAFRAALVDVLNGGRFTDTWLRHYGRTIPELWSSFVESSGT